MATEKRNIKMAALSMVTLAAWTSTVLAQSVTQSFWPTGTRAGSVLLIERVAPAEVRTGTAYDYEIKITNLTSGDMGQITITEQLVEGFEVKSITPQPASQSPGSASWTMNLGASATVSIRINGVAGAVTQIAPCNTISFSTQACQRTAVVQPALQLVKSMPAEVLLCDPIPIRVAVTNSGTGAATDVKITDNLPEGLTTTDGRNAFVVNVGTLKAGETREATVQVKATRTGTFVNEAVATEAGGLSARATAQTVVRQPVLEVTKTGPSLVFLGRPVNYEITVTNRGDGVARGTVLVDNMDSGMTFGSASDGGQAAGGKVTWNLGDLAPGTSRRVTLSGTANAIKRLSDTAVATAYCAEANASASTEVRGVPAILLEVEDVEDPIEVGQNITYVITVTNQGSAPGTNIVIKATLPAQEEFVSADGQKYETSGKTVTFAPYPTLAPKAKFSYRVVAKGVAAGDVRFAVEMTSDQLQSPVNETESTHIYE